MKTKDVFIYLGGMTILIVLCLLGIHFVTSQSLKSFEPCKPDVTKGPSLVELQNSEYLRGILTCANEGTIHIGIGDDFNKWFKCTQVVKR